MIAVMIAIGPLIGKFTQIVQALDGRMRMSEHVDTSGVKCEYTISLAIYVQT